MRILYIYLVILTLILTQAVLRAAPTMASWAAGLYSQLHLGLGVSAGMEVIVSPK